MLKKTLILFFMCIIMLTGCSQNDNKQNEENIIPAQNDWQGGFYRLVGLLNDVAESIKFLDDYNYETEMGNPLDYWSEDTFHYLHFDPLYSESLALSSYFNEYEDFSIAQESIYNILYEKGHNYISISKLNKHDYEIKYTGYVPGPYGSQTEYTQNITECIYDAEHDYLRLMSISNSPNFDLPYCYEMYEYARINSNTYAVQTKNERLYAEYDDDGNIKSFHYSQLGDSTPLTADSWNEWYVYLSELAECNTDMAKYFNRIIYVENPDRYTLCNDSMFLNVEGCNPAWVTEKTECDLCGGLGIISDIENDVNIECGYCDGTGKNNNYTSVITFEDNTLTVSVYNKLLQKYEGFRVKYVPDAEKES